MANASDNDIVKQFIVDDFIDDFMEFYAVALNETDLHPEQANNEVRNAFVHLGRYLIDSETNSEDLNKARDHLKRGKRDCLKIAIISKTDNLHNYIQSIEHYEGASLLAQKYNIYKFIGKRISLYIKETKGLPVSEDLISLFKELLEIEQNLLDKYNTQKEYKRITLLRKWGFKTVKWIIGLLGAISVTIISTYIIALMVPNGKLAEATKKVLDNLLQFIN